MRVSNWKKGKVAGLMLAMFGIAMTMPAAQAADPIKLGLLEDASGNFAIAVIPKIHAVELAVGEINAKGGILGRPIKIIAYDVGARLNLTSSAR